jgi:hypothetical protein
VAVKQSLWNDFHQTGVSLAVVFGSINGAQARLFISHASDVGENGNID